MLYDRFSNITLNFIFHSGYQFFLQFFSRICLSESSKGMDDISQFLHGVFVCQKTAWGGLREKISQDRCSCHTCLHSAEKTSLKLFALPPIRSFSFRNCSAYDLVLQYLLLIIIHCFLYYFHQQRCQPTLPITKFLGLAADAPQPTKTISVSRLPLPVCGSKIIGERYQ